MECGLSKPKIFLWISSKSMLSLSGVTAEDSDGCSGLVLTGPRHSLAPIWLFQNFRSGAQMTRLSLSLLGGNGVAWERRSELSSSATDDASSLGVIARLLDRLTSVSEGADTSHLPEPARQELHSLSREH